MTLRLTKEQLEKMEQLEIGDVIEVTYKGIDGYIERVASGDLYNIRYNYCNYLFNFFSIDDIEIKEVK